MIFLDLKEIDNAIDDFKKEFPEPISLVGRLRYLISKCRHYDMNWVQASKRTPTPQTFYECTAISRGKRYIEIAEYHEDTDSWFDTDGAEVDVIAWKEYTPIYEGKIYE